MLGRGVYALLLLSGPCSMIGASPEDDRVSFMQSVISEGHLLHSMCAMPRTMCGVSGALSLLVTWVSPLPPEETRPEWRISPLMPFPTRP